VHASLLSCNPKTASATASLPLPWGLFRFAHRSAARRAAAATLAAHFAKCPWQSYLCDRGATGSGM